MRKRFSICIVLSFLLLNGCTSKESASDYSDVRSTIKESASESLNKKSTNQTDEKVLNNKKGDVSNNENEIKSVDERLVYYPSDSHFYDSKSLEYVDIFNKAKMKFSIEDAFISNNKADGGEYFVNSKTLPSFIEITKRDYQSDVEILFIKVSITNLSDKNFTMYFNTFDVFARIKDDYGVSFRYSDKKIVSSGCGDFDFDKSLDDEVLFYANDIKAKQTITTTMAFPISVNYKSEDLYIKLGMTQLGVQDPKLGGSVQIPNDDANLKFLKINLRK